MSKQYVSPRLWKIVQDVFADGHIEYSGWMAYKSELDAPNYRKVVTQNSDLHTVQQLITMNEERLQAAEVVRTDEWVVDPFSI